MFSSSENCVHLNKLERADYNNLVERWNIEKNITNYIANFQHFLIIEIYFLNIFLHSWIEINYSLSFLI